MAWNQEFKLVDRGGGRARTLKTTQTAIYQSEICCKEAAFACKTNALKPLCTIVLLLGDSFERSKKKDNSNKRERYFWKEIGAQWSGLLRIILNQPKNNENMSAILQELCY